MGSIGGRPASFASTTFPGEVMRRALDPITGVRRLYRTAELHRTRLLETSVVTKVDVPIALSETDAAILPSQLCRPLGFPPAIAIPTRLGRTATQARIPFCSLALCGETGGRAGRQPGLPISDADCGWSCYMPDVRLRIVGARPGAEVKRLGDRSRVDVVGWVESLDSEVRSASVVACPTEFGGGVLMKFLRALALGAPSVVDESSAAVIWG